MTIKLFQGWFKSLNLEQNLNYYDNLTVFFIPNIRTVSNDKTAVFLSSSWLKWTDVQW